MGMRKIMYIWHIIRSGYSWTNVAYLIGIKFVFFLLLIPTLVLYGFANTMSLINLEQIFQNRTIYLLFTLMIISYLIVRRIDLYYHHYHYDRIFVASIVTLKDRMKIISLFIIIIFIFIIVAMLTL